MVFDINKSKLLLRKSLMLIFSERTPNLLKTHVSKSAKIRVAFAMLEMLEMINFLLVCLQIISL